MAKEELVKFLKDNLSNPDYQKEVSYDPNKDCWFVPEDWEPYDSGLGGDIGDLEDALG